MTSKTPSSDSVTGGSAGISPQTPSPGTGTAGTSPGTGTARTSPGAGSLCAPERSDGVILYSLPDQGGSKCLGFSAGSYRTTRLGAEGVRSLIVRDGFVADVFLKDELRGESKSFSVGRHNLDSVFAGNIGSLQVRPEGTPVVLVYTEPMYLGTVSVLPRGTYDKYSMGVPNDSIQSLVVRDATVHVFEQDQYQGVQRTFGAGNWTFGGDWAKKISSLVVRRPTEPLAILCAEANYRGNCRARLTGRYDVQDLGIENDSMRSLQIWDGRVTLYEHDKFRGRSQTFQGNQIWLLDWIDQVSSFEVLK